MSFPVAPTLFESLPMETTLKQLKRWHDKEHLIHQVEEVAQTGDLTRSGRKIRKFQEAFQEIGPVDPVMDPILDRRLLLAHQHFLDRRSLDMLRGGKNLDAIKDHQISQLQASATVLEQSLDRGRLLLETLQHHLSGGNDDGWLAKMQGQYRQTQESLERIRNDMEHIKLYGTHAACSLPSPME